MYTSLLPYSARNLIRPRPRRLGRPTMLSPENAMEILDVRLGITVGRSTFYRWMQSGRLFSIKLGGKIFVPLTEMEMIVERLSHGERL